MSCGLPSFSFKISFCLCPFITCCLFFKKNASLHFYLRQCWEAQCPAEGFVHTSAATCDRDSRIWEKHTSIHCNPWGSPDDHKGRFCLSDASWENMYLSVWAEHHHWIFPLIVFSLTSVIFTHNHLVLPVHEHQPCRSSTSWLREEFCHCSWIAVLLSFYVP